MMTKGLLRRLRKDRKALTPAISTTILTSAIIVMLLVTINFANNYLSARVAENEFNAMKQFMQTIGLQVDDVAWIPGRTQTMHYASKNGQVKLQSPALNYSFYGDTVIIANFTVGAIMFNMPVAAYSVANNYFERIFPSSDSFLQKNASAPVCQLFVVEKLPMMDGGFIRIVVSPVIRQITCVINNITYVKFYIPVLKAGPNPQQSQSVTLTGKNVFHQTMTGATNVTIGLDFPNGPSTGLTADFFNFAGTSETINVASTSVIEIYAGEVIVSLGLYA
jgi:hypothetical protein